MPEYSEQDLKYAAEFREEIHKEALQIVRKTHPNVTEVVDRHPVEDYFQEHWDYPGKWYTIVAIPYGYGSRRALVDTIVRDTLSGNVPKDDAPNTRELRKKAEAEQSGRMLPKRLERKPDGYRELLAEYSGLVVDYCIVNVENYRGYESHREALKSAFDTFCGEWSGDTEQASGKKIPAEDMFSSNYQKGKLNYRKAFLYPPHRNGCTGKDFARVNSALFPNGIDGLEVYEWDTEWSDYFDDGHEWWGALCMTVYDKTLSRFAVIMASATD